LEPALLTVTDTNQRWGFLRHWMSSEALGGLSVKIEDQKGNTLPAGFQFAGGQVSSRRTAVAYPGNLSTVSAVGASTDFDYRSGYSPFDATLDFVAPSAGGFASQNSFFGTIHGDR